MKSKVCAGCPKICINDGVEMCWFDNSRIGFWNDLLMGYECDYYNHYKYITKQAE